MGYKSALDHKIHSIIYQNKHHNEHEETYAYTQHGRWWRSYRFFINITECSLKPTRTQILTQIHCTGQSEPCAFFMCQDR